MNDVEKLRWCLDRANPDGYSVDTNRATELQFDHAILRLHAERIWTLEDFGIEQAAKEEEKS